VVVAMLVVATMIVSIVHELATLPSTPLRDPGDGTTAHRREDAASRRMSLYRRAAMTPLLEREVVRWRSRTEDDPDETSDPRSRPSDEAAASGEGRQRAPAPRRIFRSVCVRLCDGYYFPISSSVSRGNFAKGERVCQNRCGSEARLYIQRTPRGGVEDLKDLKDLNGRPYSELKTAFLYRSEYLPNCKCRPHPWETEAVRRHQVYALTAAAAKGDDIAAAELLALQNASKHENAEAKQGERSSYRAVPSEVSKRKSRHTSKSGERPQERRWLETIFQSTN
jgi:Protein of unknown function (DUF2865)